MSEPTLSDLQAEHGAVPVHRRHQPRAEEAEQRGLRNYVRDIILGYNDGLVSVYAVTAGVAGAAITTSNGILVTGVAAAIAGALSMAAGEYISTKSQREYYEAERARERQHIRDWPDVEKEELLESLEAKGLEGEVLHAAADAITRDEDRFLEYMMQDEFGVGEEADRSPWVASAVVIVAFLLGSLVALVPYGVVSGAMAVYASSGTSLVGLFVAGAVRARASHLPVWKAGFEMMLIGLIAAAVTYGVGDLVGARL